MDAVLTAFGLVFQPYVLPVILLSAVYGLFVGAIPGLTATMATALLVPVTFFMAPVPAVAAIVTATAMATSSAVTSRARCCACRARRPRPPTPTRPSC
jgi:putative tricarboxylic transport membrane protein